MQRFAFFVDGSNQYSSLKSMQLEVDDYERFYAYIYAEAASKWRLTTQSPLTYPTQLRRIYWYVLGSIDEWDLTSPQAQLVLRKTFDEDNEIRTWWIAAVDKGDACLTEVTLSDKAWIECLADFRRWYEHKRYQLEGMRRFHHSIRMSTAMIDVIEEGHWKVDFFRKEAEEKGLDTALAVGMIAQADNFDVAVVSTGDADSVPAIRFLKERNKVVCAVEFVRGAPPEGKGQSFSSRLKMHADFVVRIFEAELLRHGHARRPSAPQAPQARS